MNHAVVAGALAVCTAAFAQSPLQTTMAGDNNGVAGGCVYLDLEVAETLTISQCDVNLASAPGTSGSLEVYLGPSTWVAHASDASHWGLAASGLVVATGVDQPSVCVFDVPLTLGPGVYGVALRHVGVAARYTNGNGSNQEFSTAELTLRGGGASNLPFQGTPLMPRILDASIHYELGGTPVVPARIDTYGAGCYAVPGAFYEAFDANHPFDLDNSTLHLRLNGSGGYDVTRTQGVLILHQNGLLALGDDALAQAWLPFLFPFPGGVTDQIRICSNGYLWLRPSAIADYTPSVAELVAQPPRLAVAWTDFNPGAPGSGAVSFERDPLDRFVTITYDDVWLHGTTGSTLSTFQIVLFPTGDIELRYGSVAHGNLACIVGFTPGDDNFGFVSEPTDLSTATPLHTAFARPLSLTAGPRPVLGASVTLTTANVPANTSLTMSLIAFQQVRPGFDLAVFGAPGCLQHVLTDTADPLVGTLTRTLGPVPIDSNLIGLSVFSQSACLVPGVNLVGLLSSNGVAMVIGGL